MIENERQRIAAEKHIEYLHETLSGPPQSWLGSEQTRSQIMRLRKDIRAYDVRVATQNTPQT